MWSLQTLTLITDSIHPKYEMKGSVFVYLMDWCSAQIIADFICNAAMLREGKHSVRQGWVVNADEQHFYWCSACDLLSMLSIWHANTHACMYTHTHPYTHKPVCVKNKLHYVLVRDQVIWAFNMGTIVCCDYWIGTNLWSSVKLADCAAALISISAGS